MTVSTLAKEPLACLFPHPHTDTLDDHTVGDHVKSWHVTMVAFHQEDVRKDRHQEINAEWSRLRWQIPG